jgi:hypothetical protein
MAKNKTALANPPKKTDGKKPTDLKRISPGVYRNPKGELVNSSGRRINRSGQPVDKKEEDKKKRRREKKYFD